MGENIKWPISLLQQNKGFVTPSARSEAEIGLQRWLQPGGHRRVTGIRHPCSENCLRR